jgi:hypothetical protein
VIDEDATIFERAWCVYEMFQMTKAYDMAADYNCRMNLFTCCCYGLSQACDNPKCALAFNTNYFWGIGPCFAGCCDDLALWCKYDGGCLQSGATLSSAGRPHSLQVAGISRLSQNRIAALDVSKCQATVAQDKTNIIKELAQWQPASLGLKVRVLQNQVAPSNEGGESTAGLAAVNENIRRALMAEYQKNKQH